MLLFILVGSAVDMATVGIVTINVVAVNMVFVDKEAVVCV